jgi:hypothetical protein
LKPRGYIYPVAEQVSSAHHHVADVHANAKADAAIRCETGVHFGQSSLRFYRALHRLHGASELRKDTVTRRIRYASPVFPNEPVEDRAALGQAFECANLVSAHEAAVALHIRCEDCDEASADFRRV